MGVVKLNIVGYNLPYKMEKEFNSITLKDIYVYLMRKELLFTKLKKCRFVHGGCLLEIDKHDININDSINIYIVCNDKNFKNELIENLFKYNLSSEIIDNNDPVEEEVINNNLMEYFTDADFINLLNIIKNKPEYLQLVNSYLSHGDIIDKINLDEISLDDFKYNKEFEELSLNMKKNVNNWNDLDVKNIS